jgi:hypothetical protein
MKTTKLLIPLVLLLLLWSLQAAAQEKNQVRIVEEKKDPNVVSTVLVIAYGKILDPPYIFEIKNDTLFINDIPYTPRKADPNKPKPEWMTELTESKKRKYDFHQKLIDEYRENIRKMSVEEANRIIYEGFKKSDMIAKVELSPKGGSLKVQYKDDPIVRRIDLASFVLAIGYTPPTREQILEGSAAVVKSSLEGDYTECFGYNYDIGIPSTESKNLMKAINYFQSGEIDEESARKEIQKVTKKSELTEDIIRELK